MVEEMKHKEIVGLFVVIIIILSLSTLPITSLGADDVYLEIRTPLPFGQAEAYDIEYHDSIEVTGHLILLNSLQGIVGEEISVTIVETGVTVNTTTHAEGAFGVSIPMPEKASIYTLNVSCAQYDVYSTAKFEAIEMPNDPPWFICLVPPMFLFIVIFIVVIWIRREGDPRNEDENH